MDYFRTKSMADLRGEEGGLKRVLTATNLVLLGIGAIIGAGIFVLTGTAAAQYAGPGIVLSFCLAGLGCLFAGLCYAEFSSMIPVAGSAYTYGYATLGELVAWIIGWDLILEYLFAASDGRGGLVGLLHGLHGAGGLPPARRRSPARRSAWRARTRWCARRSAWTRRPAASPSTRCADADRRPPIASPRASPSATAYSTCRRWSWCCS